MPQINTERATYPYHYERDRALKAFRNHRMTIEMDEGVHRCLFFGEPGTGNYHFRVTTWPGFLCISGDIGTYVFSRLRDMFEFHASANDWARMPIEINASYWAEKIQDGGRRSVQNTLVDCPSVIRSAVERFRDIPTTQISSANRLEAFRDLRENVLNDMHEDNQPEDVADLLDGYYFPRYLTEDNERVGLVDGTSWEWGLTRKEYNYGYLICCYAIVWAIKRYAQHRDGCTQADHSRAILAGKT